jgi:pimeloyl-ACP methyl ester carboxylesterase
MADPLSIVLIPGLGCSARLYRDQVAALWPSGAVTIADHRRDETIDAIATRVLGDAPPRFALAGLSMGGFIAFAMLRQAPERIARLALLDTNARPDAPERTAEREMFIAMAQAGKFMEVCDTLMPRYLHPSRLAERDITQTVRDMATDTGSDAFIRQQRAIIGRPDARPLLASIRCPTLVLVGDSDAATPPELAKEIADGISGSTLVIVPKCGHLSTLERPDEVNAALSQWLKG